MDDLLSGAKTAIIIRRRHYFAGIPARTLPPSGQWDSSLAGRHDEPPATPASEVACGDRGSGQLCLPARSAAEFRRLTAATLGVEWRVRAR